jgi:transcriptional regulator with XRE-family HTH domain
MSQPQAVFAVELRRLLAASGMSLRRAAAIVPCSPGTLSKLCAGQHNPTIQMAEALDRAFRAGGSLAELARQQRESPPRRRETPGSAAETPTGPAVALATISGHLGPAHASLVSGWPAWFGLKLAQLITQTDTWPPSAGLGTLQMLLNQEISMSDGAVPREAPDIDMLHAVSRRQALMTLGALPLALTGTRPSPGASQVMADDMFLARCAASLTACWHLLKGSDLGSVEQLLVGYLLPLEALAYQDSPRRQAAAVFTAQAHRVCGIIALHRNQLGVREQHCRRALHFADIASDTGSHASALISLASTYFYAADPVAAAAVYERTFCHGAALPPLQQSRVHAELAVVYGQLGREQDALRATGHAEDLYPGRPEDDPSYLYAEFTRSSLALERGLAYVALAGQFPGRGYQDRAADIFGEAAGAGPARIQFEIVNHQAGVAVLQGDLDGFEAYMIRGMDGVALLGSRQRFREMRATWQQAAARWPGEKRLRAIGDRLQLAAVPGTELDAGQ